MGSVQVFLLVCCLSGIMTIMNLIGTLRTMSEPPIASTAFLINPQIRGSNDGGRFAIETPGCQIASADPFDQSIRHLIRTPPEPINCSQYGDTTGLIINQGQWLLVNETMADEEELEQCLFYPVKRVRGPVENTIDYQEGINFTVKFKLSSAFGRVECYNSNGAMIYLDFIAHIPAENEPTVSPKVRNKLNVLLVGMDSVSRLNFLRYMTKTRKVLLDEMGAFEFTGYNKVAENTFVNIVPMLTGKFVHEWRDDMSTFERAPLDWLPLIWKNFSRNLAFKTLFAEDHPEIAIFNYYKAGFFESPTTHYLRPLSLAMEEYSPLWSEHEHCIGRHVESEFVLRYVEQFIANFHKTGFFSFNFLTRLTHTDLTHLHYADRIYSEFFSRLKTKGYLKDTVIVHFSDHGLRFGDILLTETGVQETKLPFLYIVLPDTLKKTNPQVADNLRTNTKRLVTPFDIYSTIGDILKLNQGQYLERGVTTKSERSVSLFNEISDERTCEDADISPHWCSCYNFQQVVTTDEGVTNASESVVDKLNHLLRPHITRCAVLTLHQVLDAQLVKQKGNILYRVKLEVAPSQATFGATVLRSEEGYEVTGTISRLDRYGKDPECISDAKMYSYCSCIE